MAINDISLTGAMRANLVSLQQTASLLERTQTRLATGKKVNSAIDNPINYFTAQGHLNRAGDLDARKDQMNEAIQTVKAADAGIKAITGLIEQARSLAQSAMASTDATTRADYAAQFDAVRAQIDALAGDSGYKGTNLINGDNLSVEFNEDGSSSLTITGTTATSAGLGIAAAAGSWAADADITAALSNLDSALTSVRSSAQTLSSSLGVIEIRSEFVNSMINTLTEGADKLTAADANEEGANLLMLQTRQALASTALSLAAQSAQSVLRVF